MGEIANKALQRAQSFSQKRRQTLSILGADKGINDKYLSTITDISFARNIEGFIPNGKGRLTKTKGYFLEKDVGSSPIVLLKKYNSTYDIIGYGTTIAYWNRTTNEIIEAKTNFTTSGSFDGEKYGSYFVLVNGNGGNKVGYLDGTLDLDYGSLTGTFQVGETVTGGISGATATITVDTGSVLTLNNFTKNFSSGEVITGGTSGATATTSSILKNGFTEYSDSNAPKGEVLRIIDARCFVGNTNTSTSQIKWSAQDDGTGVPFSTWTADTYTSGIPKPTSANSTINRVAGDLNSIGNIGSQIIALYDDGKAGFSINILDIGTEGLSQNVQIDFQKIDFGGEKGAISTTYGIFYVNEHGLFVMTGGQGNYISESQITQVFSEEELKLYDFTTASMLYMPIDELLYISCRRDSLVNNIVLVYELSEKALAKVGDMTIGQLKRDGVYIYGTDSIEGKIYKLFDGNDNDGADIFVKYESQEIDFGDDTLVKDLKTLYVSGLLHSESAIKIYIDKCNHNYQWEDDAVILTWTPDTFITGYYRGVGKRPFGKSSSSAIGGMIENMGQYPVYLRNFTKIRIRVEENSTYPLEINKIIPSGVIVRREVKKRNLTRT